MDPTDWLPTYPDVIQRRARIVDLYQTPASLFSAVWLTIGAPRGISFPIAERASGRYRATLVGGDGVTPLTGVQLTSLRLTLYAIGPTDLDTIINGRSRQDVLNQNNVTVGPDAVLTWIVQPADTALVDPTVPFERHIALFEWTWPSGAGKQEVILIVRNLRRVP